jgi:hypothetical protein
MLLYRLLRAEVKRQGSAAGTLRHNTKPNSKGDFERPVFAGTPLLLNNFTITGGEGRRNGMIYGK